MIKFDKTIFEVNKRLTVTLLEIGNEKNRLLEVENFFKYPDRVRDFLNAVPIQYASEQSINLTNSINSFPGYQIELKYKLNDLNTFLNKAYKLAFNYSLTQDAISKLTYQCIDGNEAIRRVSNFPHIDPALFASNIFLNYDSEIGEDSGTAFYRNKNSGNEYMPMNNSIYRYNRDFVFKSKLDSLTRYAPITNNEDWEMYHLSHQKFNKLNLYEGALYHNAFMKLDTFTTTPRISLSAILQSCGI
jgi:hypothetical protein